MFKGQRVRIYCDPVTRQRLEGIARLVRPDGINTGGEYVRWFVRFLEDIGKDKQLFSRCFQDQDLED